MSRSRQLLIVVSLAAAGLVLSAVGGRGPHAPLPVAAADRDAATGEDQSEPPTSALDKPVRTVISGQVVLLADAFRKLGIKASEEETKGQVVLLTPEKELIPIVPDWRGKAFYQDERLRDRPADLIVHRRRRVPWAQVLSVYLFDEQGKRSVMDYWCDICSIPMYEIKDCECCQGPIRLRLRPQELPREAPGTTPAAAPEARPD